MRLFFASVLRMSRVNPGYGPSVAESSYWRRQIALYGRGPSDHGNELKHLSRV